MTESTEAEPLSEVSDLRETPVVDVEDEPIGRIYGALAETNSGLIRYIDVALAETPKHVLVPIGHARVDRQEEGGARVRLRAATREDMEAVPTYDPAEHPVDEPFEDSVLTSLGRLFYGERYYAHPAFDHESLYAGDHPIQRTDAPPAGAPMESGLLPLRRLPGFRLADGAQDVREWPVVTRDGTRVGVVADLVVDTQAETVRYLVIRGDGDPAALVPIGYTRVDAGAGRLELPAFEPADLPALRVYEEGHPVGRETEDTLRQTIDAMLSGSRRFDRADYHAH